MKINSATIIFPHQLFEKNPALEKGRVVFLIEEFLFFKQYNFHKQKILFHRASMKFYEDYLKRNGFDIRYIDSQNPLSDVRKLIPNLKNSAIEEIHLIEPVDNWLEKRIAKTSTNVGIKTIIYPSPMFLNSRKENEVYFAGKKKFFQTDFYINQRKKYGILLDDNTTPVGDKWSYDTENRLKYPSDKIPPSIKFPKINSYHKEAFEYVNRYFANNYGKIDQCFVYPNTFSDSKKWFEQFLEVRFSEFGLYEDAIVAGESILHHSVLTPI